MLFHKNRNKIMATQQYASACADHFGDGRVIFVHDLDCASGHDGKSRLRYEQSASGPTYAYICDDVSDAELAMMADRHGLILDQLREFRDQPYVDIMLTAPAHLALEAEAG